MKHRLKAHTVWAVGLNYRAHAAETGTPVPDVPTLFMKAPGAIIAHEEDIIIPPHVQQPDYEGEVAVVIGQRGRDIDASQAYDYIDGVTCAHDVSARDHQFATTQWSWSKSFDTFCPLGPTVVTLVALHDAELNLLDLGIETRVNGEVLQSSRTSDMVFSIPQLIAHVSQGVTLEVGDVILTGTPAGVGFARTPPRWLQDGDVVEITVEGVGTLRNRVRRS